MPGARFPDLSARMLIFLRCNVARLSRSRALRPTLRGEFLASVLHGRLGRKASSDPHLGGVLPYVAGRISPLPGSKAEHPIEHYLKTRFYADTAAATPAALDLAVRAYGADRLVFATDHPFGPMTALRRYVENNLPPQTASRIYANRIPDLSFSVRQRREGGYIG